MSRGYPVFSATIPSTFSRISPPPPVAVAVVAAVVGAAAATDGAIEPAIPLLCST